MKYADQNAFPVPASCDPIDQGLTRLEYFAAAALQGILASDKDITCGTAALFAVEAAQKLIAELQAKGGA